MIAIAYVSLHAQENFGEYGLTKIKSVDVNKNGFYLLRFSKKI
jgi:hypothetical protein